MPSGTPCVASHASCTLPSRPPECFGVITTLYAGWPATLRGYGPPMSTFCKSWFSWDWICATEGIGSVEALPVCKLPSAMFPCTRCSTSGRRSRTRRCRPGSGRRRSSPGVRAGACALPSTATGARGARKDRIRALERGRVDQVVGEADPGADRAHGRRASGLMERPRERRAWRHVPAARGGEGDRGPAGDRDDQTGDYRQQTLGGNSAKEPHNKRPFRGLTVTIGHDFEITLTVAALANGTAIEPLRSPACAACFGIERRARARQRHLLAARGARLARAAEPPRARWHRPGMVRGRKTSRGQTAAGRLQGPGFRAGGPRSLVPHVRRARQVRIDGRDHPRIRIHSSSAGVCSPTTA